MFPEKKSYKSDHVILDKETYEHDLKDFSFTFIELPKFIKTIDELSTLGEKWYYFFKHAEETSPEDLKKLIGKDEIIEKVYQELNRFFWNEEELLAYDRAEKAKNDYLSSMEKKFMDGKAEGISEERSKAEQEKAALQIKAEQEKLSTIKDMARNLLKSGVSISIIQSTTQLSKEEIERLYISN